MINIVLFDKYSVFRIAEKAASYFSKWTTPQFLSNKILLDGAYIKFSPRLISVVFFDSEALSKYDIINSLKQILCGEEVYISRENDQGKYIENVNCSTSFDLLRTN